VRVREERQVRADQSPVLLDHPRTSLSLRQTDYLHDARENSISFEPFAVMPHQRQCDERPNPLCAIAKVAVAVSLSASPYRDRDGQKSVSCAPVDGLKILWQRTSFSRQIWCPAPTAIALRQMSKEEEVRPARPSTLCDDRNLTLCGTEVSLVHPLRCTDARVLFLGRIVLQLTNNPLSGSRTTNTSTVRVAHGRNTTVRTAHD